MSLGMSLMSLIVMVHHEIAEARDWLPTSTMGLHRWHGWCGPFTAWRR